jgi:hypothetical protein
MLDTRREHSIPIAETVRRSVNLRCTTDASLTNLHARSPGSPKTELSNGRDKKKTRNFTVGPMMNQLNLLTEGSVIKPDLAMA